MPTMTPPKFLGPQELAERWGITRQRVSQLVKDGKIPPGEMLAKGRVWTLEEIEEHERKGGRSPLK